ncbi:TetR/AcrR family transcriptional regulator, partial [Agromyces humi]|uniref:TetR/AcrR family transcriptional regulator n=1 Tax=Agromyces humi TaxID=1766800 RepID=UPI001358539C
MPTPDRTSLEAIVEAGRALLEADGLDGLTMQAVADRVGVRAPSLYKRVRNRDALVARIAEATLQDLSARLEHVGDLVPGTDAAAELARLARAV